MSRCEAHKAFVTAAYNKYAAVTKALWNEVDGRFTLSSDYNFLKGVDFRVYPLYFFSGFD